MKKIMLGLSFILIFLCQQSFAQDGIKFGFKVSVTASNINYTDKSSIAQNRDFIDGNSFNPSIGLFAIFLKTNHLNLETEITYLRKATSETGEIKVVEPGDFDGTNPIKLHYTYEVSSQYIQIGINAQPKYQIGNINTYIIVGPTLDYLMKTTVPYSGDELKRLQIGYNAGIGTNLSKAINKEITLELKYQGDLTPFFESNYKSWNRVVMFSVGVGV